MFIAEHAENAESQDNHLGSSYNPFFLRHLGGKR